MVSIFLIGPQLGSYDSFAQIKFISILKKDQLYIIQIRKVYEWVLLKKENHE